MNDYPSAADLGKLERWPLEDWDAAVTFARELWNTDYGLWSVNPDGTIYLATGGWSGNEDIVCSLQNSGVWGLLWISSARGGGHLLGQKPCPSDPTGDALRTVRRERWRQEELKAAGKFDFTCADDGMTDAERDTVLTEEVGEVAEEVEAIMLARLAKAKGRVSHEVNEGIGLTREVEYTKLLEELTQVAAVAVAWMEQIGRRSKTRWSANERQSRMTKASETQPVDLTHLRDAVVEAAKRLEAKTTAAEEAPIYSDERRLAKYDLEWATRDALTAVRALNAAESEAL